MRGGEAIRKDATIRNNTVIIYKRAPDYTRKCFPNENDD